MKRIMRRALVVVDLNLSGWQMAYQRSTLITLSVSTDTLTLTPCNEKTTGYSSDCGCSSGLEVAGYGS